MALVGELYRGTYETYFKDHPNKGEIIEKLIRDEVPPAQRLLWITEAEVYTAQKVKDNANGISDEAHDILEPFEGLVDLLQGNEVRREGVVPE